MCRRGLGEARWAVGRRFVKCCDWCARGVLLCYFFFFSSRRRHTRFDCDWSSDVCSSDLLLSNGRGTLLPRNWPKEYFPIRTITPEGKIAATDHSVLQSHVIESWSMSWWGFQKGKSALMVIVETPDDAAYQFSHLAGGPTVIGPRWHSQLGRF